MSLSNLLLSTFALLEDVAHLPGGGPRALAPLAGPPRSAPAAPCTCGRFLDSWAQVWAVRSMVFCASNSSLSSRSRSLLGNSRPLVLGPLELLHDHLDALQRVLAGRLLLELVRLPQDLVLGRLLVVLHLPLGRPLRGSGRGGGRLRPRRRRPSARPPPPPGPARGPAWPVPRAPPRSGGCRTSCSTAGGGVLRPGVGGGVARRAGGRAQAQPREGRHLHRVRAHAGAERGGRAPPLLVTMNGHRGRLCTRHAHKTKRGAPRWATPSWHRYAPTGRRKLRMKASTVPRKACHALSPPPWHAMVFAFLRRRAISPQSCQIGEHARDATERSHDHHDCCAGDVRRCVRSDPLSHPLDCHSHTPTGAAGARPGDWPPPRPASFGSAARATRPPRQPPVSAARSDACRRSLH